jgi:hypothetical protein
MEHIIDRCGCRIEDMHFMNGSYFAYYWGRTASTSYLYPVENDLYRQPVYQDDGIPSSCEIWDALELRESSHKAQLESEILNYELSQLKEVA